MKNVAMVYKSRRDALSVLVSQEHAAFGHDPIMLFAPCENPSGLFVQDSSFYYFSGITQPGCVIMLDQGRHCIYKQEYPAAKQHWVVQTDDMSNQALQAAGFDKIDTTGQMSESMHLYPYFDFSVYQHVIHQIEHALAAGKKICTLYPTNSYDACNVRMIVDRLALVIPHLKENIIDISAQIAQLRRVKDMSEIESLYKAIDITVQGHYAGVAALKINNKESDMQAAIEYVFTQCQATTAYPSIVGSGFAGTILHYHKNDQKFIQGDLVVVDAGARYGYYCADITRTYPVSGKFTDEQKYLYELVLACQELVAEHAKPGVWISNVDDQENSLHHIAVNFFKQHGYDQYFIHGIGHFLGLDVHDVGDRSRPLQHGDVITIEPGLYIPEKNIGIRIEDNYWIVDQTTPVCLSEGLPKTVKEIEDMMQDLLEVDLV